MLRLGISWCFSASGTGEQREQGKAAVWGVGLAGLLGFLLMGTIFYQCTFAMGLMGLLRIKPMGSGQPRRTCTQIDRNREWAGNLTTTMRW